MGSLGGTTTTLSCLLPSPKDKTSMSLQCLARTSSSGHLAFKGPNCDLLELFHVGGTQSWWHRTSHVLRGLVFVLTSQWQPTPG